MFGAVTLSLCSRDVTTKGVLATRHQLARVYKLLRADAAGFIRVSLTASIAATKEAANSVDTLGIVGTRAVLAFVDLLLALYLWIAVVVGRT